MESRIFLKSVYLFVIYWVSITGITILLSTYFLLSHAYNTIGSSSGYLSMYDLFNIQLTSSTNATLQITSFILGLVAIFFVSRRFFKKYPDTSKEEIKKVVTYFAIFGLLISIPSFLKFDLPSSLVDIVRICGSALATYYFLYIQSKKHSLLFSSTLSDNVNIPQQAKVINDAHLANLKSYNSSRRSLILWLIIWLFVTIFFALSFIDNSSSDNGGVGFGILFFYVPLTYVFISHLLKFIFNKKQK